MGNLLEQMCCIDTNTIIENNEFREALNFGKNSLKPFYSSNIKKELPENEIKFKTISRRKKRVKTLSELPVSKLNVIRLQRGNPFDYYEPLYKKLGAGTFGHVYKVRHKTTGTIRAMKTIPKDNKIPGFTDEDIIQEIEILKKLDHPYIIKIFEFFVDNKNYYLINEYCSEGDLGEKLSKIDYLSEDIVRLLMFQIFNAVLYLHSNKVIHGDLKLDNIMIDSLVDQKDKNDNKNPISFISSIKEANKEIQNKIEMNELINLSKTISSHLNNNLLNSIDSNSINNTIKSAASMKSFKYQNSTMKKYELKLIDFGCSKIFNKYKKNFEDTIGTLVYCSPEVLLNNYNEKCDIWSCGVIMYLLLSKEFPFFGINQDEIVEKILNGKFEFSNKFKNVSEEAKDLIRNCLKYDKKSRFSAKEALKHKFFSDEIDPYNIYQDTINSKEILTSLKKISKKHSKFYQAVLAFLSHNFALKSEIERLKKVFYKIDRNLDGKLSKEEISKAYKAEGIHITNGELDNILTNIDFDNNGYIEFEEFIMNTIPKKHLFTDANLKTAFDMFDLDKNGSISLNEVKEVLGMGKEVDDQVLNELRDEINTNGDEELNFEEFKNLMYSFAENDVNNNSFEIEEKIEEFGEDTIQEFDIDEKKEDDKLM